MKRENKSEPWWNRPEKWNGTNEPGSVWNGKIPFKNLTNLANMSASAAERQTQNVQLINGQPSTYYHYVPEVACKSSAIAAAWYLFPAALP